MSTNAYPGPRPDRATAQHKRDAALARLTRVRGLTIAGAGALTAVVAGVVSSASGHTLGATHAIRTAAVTSSTAAAPAQAVTKMPPLAGAQQLGLTPPGASPQPAPQQGPNAVAQAQAQAAAPQAAAPQPQSVPAPAVSGGS